MDNLVCFYMAYHKSSPPNPPAVRVKSLIPQDIPCIYSINSNIGGYLIGPLSY